VLVPVLRGRAAVTLAHPLSLAAWPREHQSGCQPDRGRSKLRRPLYDRVSDMTVLPSRSLPLERCGGWSLGDSMRPVFRG
jgi:hypothetical protein